MEHSVCLTLHPEPRARCTAASMRLRPPHSAALHSPTHPRSGSCTCLAARRGRTAACCPSEPGRPARQVEGCRGSSAGVCRGHGLSLAQGPAGSGASRFGTAHWQCGSAQAHRFVALDLAGSHCLGSAGQGATTASQTLRAGKAARRQHSVPNSSRMPVPQPSASEQPSSRPVGTPQGDHTLVSQLHTGDGRRAGRWSA